VPLSEAASDVLDQLRKKIEQVIPFQQKVEEAQLLWKSKESNIAGKNAFTEVRALLKKMCVSVEVCNYCEQNEASDIEHIAPKSFFPEHTFNWNNYLLAFKQCNTGYKLDQCFVIDNLDEVIAVPRKSEPLFKEIAFINPRIENPNRFMILDTKFTFKFFVFDYLSLKDKNKAKKTIEILCLNERDTLIEARKSSAQYFYQRLELLSRILKASSNEEIEFMLSPYDNLIDSNNPIDQVKKTIKNGFKKDILEHQHPSVWFAIKEIESKTTPKWKKLFDEIPDALFW
jgi:uncharacterized protein (TIGR02646 family)